MTENEAVAAIAEMMGEFVDSWPEHKKLSTSIALVHKTLRASIPIANSELERQIVERVIDRMGWPEIDAFNERLGQDVYEDAGGFMLRKIKRLFGIKRDTVLSYQDAARAMLKNLDERQLA